MNRDRIEGKREQMIGKIQERYGCERDEAERQVDTFWDRYDDRGEQRRAA